MSINSLPPSQNLPVKYLSASFDNVTNSYKFYWFLAILEHVHYKRGRIIPVRQLISRMIANVWYPANYFRLSFGKQDRLGQITSEIGLVGSLPVDAKKTEIAASVLSFLDEKSARSRDIESLLIYVPYRFLRPFFANELRGLKDNVINSKVEKMANEAYCNFENPCLYKFLSEPDISIEIHPVWYEYLNQHISILKDFCLWNLVVYLQKNNPNTSNISSKLFEPTQRDLKNAKEFWKIAFEKLGSIRCVYSGKPMNRQQFSLDHFLPWRFVSHDLLWNIIPSPKSVNSSKSDNLPDVEKYFSGFAEIQYQAVQTVGKSGKLKLLEDHLLLIKVKSVEDLVGISYGNFRDVLSDTIMPQFQIAENMGFSSNWIYSQK
jgi:hypothetical protein